MRGAGTEFNRIAGAVKIYQDSVSDALRRYSEKSRNIKRAAEAYKDESGFISKNLVPLKEEARREISAARKEFAKRMQEERSELEKLLFEKVSAVPNRAFSDLLRFYVDFGITPGRMEISALLTASEGNALAIRALNQYLAKTQAGYRIEASPFESFAADLDRIEKLQRAFWTGNDFPVEAGEVFNGTPRASYVDGKEVQRGYQWDSTSRAMENASFAEHVKALEKAAEAWAAEVLPKVVEDEDGQKKQVPNDLPHVVEEADSSSEAWAKRTGEKQAAETARAREALATYIHH